MGFDTIEINLVLWSIHDTWPMTLNTWHFTHDTEYMTLYTWHMTLNEWHFTHDTRYMNLTHNTWHMTLDTAGFEEFSNIRMGAIAQTKFLSNGNQMHQLQQKITSRQQFVDWTTWPCLKKVFLHFVWLKNTHLSFNSLWELNFFELKNTHLSSASLGNEHWPSNMIWEIVQCLNGDFCTRR